MVAAWGFAFCVGAVGEVERALVLVATSLKAEAVVRDSDVSRNLSLKVAGAVD